jgi:hypothetical protein
LLSDVELVRDQYLNLLSDLVDYAILGLEKTKNDIIHIQGYIKFKKKEYFTSIKKLFPRAHFEIKKGSVEQAISYVKKEGDYDDGSSLVVPKEIGVVPVEQGARTDFHKILSMIQDGCSLEEIKSIYAGQ